MHAEVEELRPKLKEILYDCAVDIRATKAALYLFDGTSLYELVTEYGFRGNVRPRADVNDALIDRCGRARTPFFINGVGAEPRFSELLFASSTDRLLAAPLYSRGKLIGVVDMRDKAGKQPFEQSDVPKAQQIADRLVALLGDRNIFGHRFITLSTISGQHNALDPGQPGVDARAVTGELPVREYPAPAQPAVPAPALAPRPAPPSVRPPQVVDEAARAHVPRLATLVIEARSAAGRIVVAPAPETLSESDLAAAREVLRSILLIPGAVAVTLTAYGHLGGVQEIAARTSLGEDAKNLIESKLNVWLSKRGEAGGYVKTSVHTPLGTSGAALTAGDVQKVFTAPLAVGALRGLFLTVVFGNTPDRAAHDLMAVLHSHLQTVLESGLQRNALASLEWRVAQKLLEPDFSKYPELRRHSEAVSVLAERFARHLALSPLEVEQCRIVGLVHDVGMRLLDYERLYRKKDLSQEELAFLREHPSVGAVMVEPLLGTSIARAVLCHHERVDGHGYPHELQGKEIPLVSRVVQICEAWVAMTDAETYQDPLPPPAAAAALNAGSGSQFDGELVPRFLEVAGSAV